MTTSFVLVHSFLVVHLVATLLMVGIIWMVQVVHYPLMAFTGPEHAPRYQQLHVRRMAWLVTPIMIVEATCSVWLFLNMEGWLFSTGIALLAGIWLVTLMVSVPSHNVLVERFDSSIHRRLVSSNALRAALWTSRGVLALSMVVS